MLSSDPCTGKKKAMVTLPAKKTVDHENVQKKKIDNCPKNDHSEKGAGNVKIGNIETIECQSPTISAPPLTSHTTPAPTLSIIKYLVASPRDQQTK